MISFRDNVKKLFRNLESSTVKLENKKSHFTFNETCYHIMIVMTMMLCNRTTEYYIFDGYQTIPYYFFSELYMPIFFQFILIATEPTKGMYTTCHYDGTGGPDTHF